MSALRQLKTRPAIGLIIVFALVAGVAALVATHRGGDAPTAVARLAPLDDQHLRHRFADLSRAHSNRCSLASANLDQLAVGGKLQGSCCRPMVYTRYVAQVRGLRRFAHIDEVPPDPYDVPVSLATRLIRSDHAIRLDLEQQRVYDQAVRLSHEHGPCCCRCWRWSAFRGQAKELIVRRRFSASDIARIWNLEDGCGGA